MTATITPFQIPIAETLPRLKLRIDEAQATVVMLHHLHSEIFEIKCDYFGATGCKMLAQRLQRLIAKAQDNGRKTFNFTANELELSYFMLFSLERYYDEDQFFGLTICVLQMQIKPQY
jgi:hypothetical protein